MGTEAVAFLPVRAHLHLLRWAGQADNLTRLTWRVESGTRNNMERRQGPAQPRHWMMPKFQRIGLVASRRYPS
eukprot:2890035-Pyramimonas_sp.AAC.1